MSDSGPCHGTSNYYSKEYRTPKAYDYLASSTYRGNVTVHNLRGRGYDPKDPHPEYKGLNSRYHHLPIRPRPAAAGKGSYKCSATAGSSSQIQLSSRTSSVTSSFEGSGICQSVCSSVNPSCTSRATSISESQVQLLSPYGQEKSKKRDRSTSDVRPNGSADSHQSPDSAPCGNGLREARQHDANPPYSASGHLDLALLSKDSLLLSDNLNQPGDTFNDVAESSRSSIRQLPCEFVGYSGCKVTFHPEEMSAWVEHISQHLCHELPTKCVCWFCDDFEFDAEKHGCERDKYANFFERMEHIRSHIVDDRYEISQIRPDFHFLALLKEKHLVTDKMYQAATAWDETPGPHVEGIYSYDFVPFQEIRALEPCHGSLIQQSGQDIRRQRGSSERSVSEATTSTQNKKRPVIVIVDQRNGVASHHKQYVNPDQPAFLAQSDRQATCRSSQALNSPKRCTTPTSDLNDGGKVGVMHDTLSFAHMQGAYGVALASEIPSNCMNSGSNPSSQTKRAVKVGHLQSIQSSTSLDRYCTELKGPVDYCYSTAERSGLIDGVISRLSELISTEPPSSSQRAPYGSSGRQVTAQCFGESSSSGCQSSKLSTPRSNRQDGLSRKRKSGQESEEEPSDQEGPLQKVDDFRDDQKKGPRLACPYFKHDPAKYGTRQTCCGPGFDTIHRMKEHLFRSHEQSKHICARCWKPFKTGKALASHLRQAILCPVEEEQDLDGFDDAQARQLRARKQESPKPSEDNQWKSVYRILFPNVNDQDIPSPYYHFDTIYTVYKQEKSSALREAYTCSNLPLRLKLALEQEGILIQDELIIHCTQIALGGIANDLAQNLHLNEGLQPNSHTRHGVLPPNSPILVSTAQFTMAAKAQINNEDNNHEPFNTGISGSSMCDMDLSFPNYVSNIETDISWMEQPDLIMGLPSSAVLQTEPDSTYGSLESQGTGRRAKEPK